MSLLNALIVLFGCGVVCTVLATIWLQASPAPRAAAPVVNFLAAVLVMLLSLYLLVRH